MDAVKKENEQLKIRNVELEAKVAELTRENASLRQKNELLEKSFADLMSKLLGKPPEGNVPPMIKSPRGEVTSRGTMTLPLPGKKSSARSTTQTESRTRRSNTLTESSKPSSGSGSLPSSNRSSSSVIVTSHSVSSSPREEGTPSPSSGRTSSSSIATVTHKAWGVALRDHFASGVTVPSAVTHLVSHIKHFLLDLDAASPTSNRAKVLFANLDATSWSADLAALRNMLEFGDAVPPNTSVENSCKLLLSYLSSLPEPVVLPESTLLLQEALSITDPEYQLQSLRSIIQSTFPYNHRVLLQVLVSLLLRIKDAGLDVDPALESLSVAMFPKGTVVCKALLNMITNNDAFPTSNLFVQYTVDKSHHGKMFLKSVEYGTLLNVVTHRFTQEPRTTSALLALHSRWLRSPEDMVHELSNQHLKFAPFASGWQHAARVHVLFFLQSFLELSPELFQNERFWSMLRKTTRAWQKECTADAGDSERKLRKWLKSSHKRAVSSHTDLMARLQALQEVGSTPQLPVTELWREFDPKVFAEQICLLDTVHFRLIPKSELMRGDALSGSKVEEVAPNWFRMIQSFNALSQSVVTSILSANLPSQRAECIVFFLKVADHLQHVLANFNASYAIISALSDASVERLKMSWSRVSEDFLQLYQKLQNLWSISHNFRTYRDEIQRAKDLPPAIPYCGLISKDLFAIEENNRSDVVSSPAGGADHVNVEKFRLLWDKLEAFVKLQNAVDYVKLTPNPRIQWFLLNIGKPMGFKLLDVATYKTVSLNLEKKATQVSTTDA